MCWLLSGGPSLPFATSPSLTAQYCCGISICRDIQKLPGHSVRWPYLSTEVWPGDLQVSANLSCPSVLWNCPLSSHTLKLLKWLANCRPRGQASGVQLLIQTDWSFRGASIGSEANADTHWRRRLPFKVYWNIPTPTLPWHELTNSWFIMMDLGWWLPPAKEKCFTWLLQQKLAS